MMAAHPQEVKNGKFTRGVRESVDDATHEALNTCIQQEDEVEENAANRRAKQLLWRRSNRNEPRS